jgi:hypothetical protein
VEILLGPQLLAIYGAPDGDSLSECGVLEYAFNFMKREPEPLTSLPTAAELRAFWESAHESDVAQAAACRAQLISLFVGVISNQRKAVGHFLPAIEALATHIQGHTVVSKSPRVQLRYRVVINDQAGFYAFVAALLLDDQRSFGVRLRRCEYCRGFFLKGKREKRFCTETCMSSAHDLKGVRRMQKLREARSARKHK